MQIHSVTVMVAALLLAIVAGVASGLILSRRRKPEEPAPAEDPKDAVEDDETEDEGDEEENEEDAFPDPLRLWAFYASARRAAMKVGTEFVMGRLDGEAFDDVALQAAQTIGQQEGAEVAKGNHREILTVTELEEAVRRLLGLPTVPAKDPAAAPEVDAVPVKHVGPEGFGAMAVGDARYCREKEQAELAHIRSKMTPGDLQTALEKAGWTWSIPDGWRSRSRYGEDEDRGPGAADLVWHKDGNTEHAWIFDAAIVDLYKSGKLKLTSAVPT